MVLHTESELVGLDLDKCIKDGAFSNEAREGLLKVNSYSEISPSGEGSESFYTGSFPKRERKETFECYDEGRHLTVTGNHIPDTPKVINRDQGVIDWFRKKFIATGKVEDSSQGKVQETFDKNEMVPAETASDVQNFRLMKLFNRYARAGRKKNSKSYLMERSRVMLQPVKRTLRFVPFYHSGRTRHLD